MQRMIPDKIRSYVILGPCACILLVGCAGNANSHSLAPDAYSQGKTPIVEAVGDWDDLDAAISAVNERYALGTVSRKSDDGLAEYRLLDIRSRPIMVRFERRSPDIVIEVRVGRFGDPLLARRIARDLALRLEQLYGVETAPLDWSGGS